jgi:hypothetical protein
MFNKKKGQEKKLASQQNVEALNLPAIFVMPELFLSSASQEIKLKKKKIEKKVKVGAQNLEPVQKTVSAVIVPKKTRLIHPAVIVFGVILILAIIAGSAYLYYMQQPKISQPKVAKTNTEINTNNNENTNINANINAEVNTNINTNTNTSVDVPIKITNQITTFASYAITSDLDKDYLTDYEENLYGTSLNNKDEDGDTYTDGLEFVQLYSPKEKLSGRLIDSGLVKVFNNTEQGYSVFYPTSWKVREFETDKSSISFESSSEEFVQVLVTPNIVEENVVEWATKEFPDIDASKLERVVVGDFHGIKSPTGLAINFLNDNKLYSLIYQIGTIKQLNFKATFEMMVNSFELKNRTGNTSDITANDWLKYSSTELGVAFNYPEFVEIDAIQKNILSLKTFSLQFFDNAKKLDLNAWFEENYNKPENKDCDMRSSELKIGKLKTSLIDKPILNDEGKFVCVDAGYYAISDDKARIVKLNVGTSAIKEMAQILSTLQLIEKKIETVETNTPTTPVINETIPATPETPVINETIEPVIEEPILENPDLVF